MQQLLGMLRRDALPLFVTLTYPREFSSDWHVWKRHLDTFGKWLRRRYPLASALWKLELQDRSAPHFHLLVFGVAFIPYQVLARRWFEIVGSGDPNHLNAGTSVEAVRSRNGVMCYASKKYMGKEYQGEAALGRCWGLVNRSALPLSVRRRIYLPAVAAFALARLVRARIAQGGPVLRPRPAYTLFSNAPEDWLRAALCLGGEESG